jgi:tetratricopeptide (TPR) repeat protein
METEMRKLVNVVGIVMLAVLFGTVFFSSKAAGQNRRDVQRANRLVTEGNQLFNQRNYTAALEKYAEAIVLAPRNAGAYFWKGMSHHNLDQGEMALAEFDKALTYGYERPVDIYRVRWRIHFARKDYAAALGDVTNGSSIDPNNFEFVLARGDLNFVQKKYNDAIPAYLEATEKQPTNGAIHLNLAWSYYYTGNTNAQYNYAKQALTRGVQNPADAHLLIADAAYKLRRYQEATESYKQALRANPDNYEIYRRLADLHRIQNQYGEAIAISRQALTRLSSTGQASRELQGQIFTDLSWYYSLNEQHTEASEAAKAGTTFLPNEYMAYTNLCRAYNDLNKPEMAIRECNNALRLRPGDGETHFYLGYSNSLLGRTAEAERNYRLAVAGLEQFTRENLTYSDGFYLLGNAYFANGQIDKAIAAYKKSLELSPGFPRAVYNLGFVLVQKKDKAGALEQHRILSQLDTKRADQLKKEIDKL